jgi:hypothetical protein
MAQPTQWLESDHSRSFDVRQWLSELTGLDGWSVQRTFTRRKVEFVTAYGARDGGTAEVTIQAVPAGSHPSWELVAKAGPLVAGIVIPASTRVSW